jgi:hypothetical protein
MGAAGPAPDDAGSSAGRALPGACWAAPDRMPRRNPKRGSGWPVGRGAAVASVSEFHAYRGRDSCGRPSARCHPSSGCHRSSGDSRSSCRRPSWGCRRSSGEMAGRGIRPSAPIKPPAPAEPAALTEPPAPTGPAAPTEPAGPVTPPRAGPGSGAAGDDALACGLVDRGPPGHASSAIASQVGNSGRAGCRCGRPTPSRGGAGAWVQGSSLSGSGAGSHGGLPDTLDGRAWLARCEPWARRPPERPPLAAAPGSPGGSATESAAPGNALSGIAALPASRRRAVGSGIGAHGGAFTGVRLLAAWSAAAPSEGAGPEPVDAEPVDAELADAEPGDAEPPPVKPPGSEPGPTGAGTKPTGSI